MSPARAAAVLADLVAIDSGNPATCGGDGEAAVAAFVRGWLGALDVEVVEHPVGPGRPVVMATAHGTSGAVGLTLVAHLDTALRGGRAPQQRGDRLYGVGSADDKSGVAIALSALARARERRARRGLHAVLVCDEEHASAGLRSVLASLPRAPAIVLEPSGGAVALRHSGAYAIRARATSPTGLGLALAVLGRRSGPGVRIRCRAVDAEAPTVEIRWDVDAEARLDRGHVEAAAGGLQSLGVIGNWRVAADRPPLRAPRSVVGADLVTCGAPRGRTGLHGWTEAGLLSRAGLDVAVLGPVGGGLHTPREWVSLRSVEAVARFLERLTALRCG